MDYKKLASDCYRKGVEAMDKKNWDLAVEMFGMCAKFIPENLMYRQLLRNCEQKKYNDNKTGAGTLAKSKLIGIRGRIKKARAKEEWNEVDKACEEGLAVNPWDVQLNVDLGEAAAKRQYMDVARFALRTAWDVDKTNKQLSWQLAELLEERGEYDEASKIWEHICRLDPNDGAARSKLTGSHTKKTLDRGGYENADTTRQVMTNKALAAKGGTAAPGESQEADLKHAIRKEPEKTEHYLKLADLYKREARLDQAHATLEQALQVSGNDANVRELLEDVELLRMKENLEKAKERAAQGNDDTARKNAAALSIEFNKRRLEVLTRRVERYPQDLTLKFDLGYLLMAGFQKWPQAIPLLQQASQNKRIKSKALALLGKCFMADKKPMLAKGQLERAVAELTYDEDPKLYLDTCYNLARVCEESGDKTAAEAHYGEILVRDYEYKDARERLEKLQGGGTEEEG